MPSLPKASEAARFVRQRDELGAGDWILEGLSREQALQMASRAAARPKIDRGGTGLENLGPGTTRVETLLPVSASFAVLPERYEALRAEALACTRCRLSGERKQVVFADGNSDARVMVVGEAPGANEDRTGLPFVGAAGKLLDLLLAAVDLSREESVYICNVIKCRPPGNRNPRPDEIDTCAPFLRQQIALVRPEVILAVGTFAGQLLSGVDRPLGKLRGEVYAYEGIPLVVTYHPAALLRNPGWTRSTWDDLQLLRDVLDGR